MRRIFIFAISGGISGNNLSLSLYRNWYHALAIFLGGLDLPKMLPCPKDEVFKLELFIINYSLISSMAI